MYFIAHRGNVNGSIPAMENKPEYINEALQKGYDVEVDVWCIRDKMFLGHDEPQYQVESDFFLEKKLWCHGKNLEAIVKLEELDAHYFWHENDDITLTSKKYMWTYPGIKLTKKSICVMPEYSNYTPEQITTAIGICSDNIQKYFVEVKNNE
jgi:hypothetical protein